MRKEAAFLLAFSIPQPLDGIVPLVPISATKILTRGAPVFLRHTSSVVIPSSNIAPISLSSPPFSSSQISKPI